MIEVLRISQKYIFPSEIIRNHLSRKINKMPKIISGDKHSSFNFYGTE